MMESLVIGFIGGGHMTSSLVAGLKDSGFDPKRIWACDRHAEKREHLIRQFGVHVSPFLEEVIKHAHVLVLAVKPQNMPSLCQEIKTSLEKYPSLVVSLA